MKLFLEIVLLLQLSLPTLARTWVKRSMSRDLLPLTSSVIDLTTPRGPVCVFDPVVVEWRMDSAIGSDDIFLAVAVESRDEVSLSSLIQEFEGGEHEVDYVIKCHSEDTGCVPSIGDITASSVDPQHPVLGIHFLEPTNTPPLRTTASVLHALHLQPDIVGSAVGSWISPTVLNIQVTPEFFETVLQAHNQGTHFSARLHRRSLTRPVPTSIQLRPTEIGTTTIFAVNRTTMQVVSAFSQISVTSCSDSFIPSSSSASSGHTRHVNPSKPMLAPQPELRIRGIVPMVGSQSLDITSQAAPAMNSGSWSLTMWIRLLDGPTGSFRNLFFKGFASTGQRSPSAWLLPATNRLAMRVSTVADVDIGSDSNIEIPINEWTLVSFVFQNLSSSAGGSSKYAWTYYLNSHKDASLEFGEVVVGNDAPLQLFKDPSHDGVRGFAKDIVVWNSPLSESDVRNIYFNGRGDTSSVDIAMKVLSPTSAVWDKFENSENSENPLLKVTPVVTQSLSGETVVSELINNVWSSKGDARRSTSTSTGKASAAGDGAEEKKKSAADVLLDEGKTLYAQCAQVETRLDKYAEAAWLGSAEALHMWAMLLGFGSETSEASCGISSRQSENSAGQHADEIITDQSRAAYALLHAADMGHTESLVPLSVMLLTGAGLAPFLYNQLIISESWAIPLPPDRRSKVRSDSIFQVVVSPTDRDTDCANSLEDCPTNSESGQPVESQNYVHSQFQVNFVNALVESVQSCNSDFRGSSDGQVGASVFCWKSYDMNNGGFTSSETSQRASVDPVTNLALGLLHIATLFRNADAQAALMYRYSNGIGLIRDPETAAQYGVLASTFSSECFHKRGAQPIVESDRIDDFTEPQIEKGNRGDEDEMIRHQKILADEGDVPSMLSMGDLYYYGAHGMPRDQAQALHYYNLAADRGNTQGMCGAAGMMLKGEGGAKDVSGAISLYENAAAMGSVRALNGLGYIYFYGQEVPKNETRAFRYFLEASEYQTDADSLYNAGFCYQNGLGVEKNPEKAAVLYHTATNKFGHFGSVTSLGLMYMKGEGTPRSSSQALAYLTAAANVGPWSQWLRRGLDHYLLKDYARSLLCYLYAGEMGFEVSQANAAFILRRRLGSNYMNLPASYQSHSGSNPSVKALSPRASLGSDLVASSTDISLFETLQMREYFSSAFHQNKDSMFYVGQGYYLGLGVPRNPARAAWWYTKASTSGHMVSSVYLGVMNQFGFGMPKNQDRALRYYTKALDHADNGVQSSYSLPTELKLLVQTLQWRMTSGLSSLLSPFVESTVDFAVKTLWGDSDN